MHEFLDKLSTQDLAKVMIDTDRGLNAIKEILNETEQEDKFDVFIEETCELLCYLFTHFKKEE